MSQSETYNGEAFCTNCKKRTPHTIHSDGHERDSSWDWQRCHICGWRYMGITGKYSEDKSEPFNEE